MLAGGGLIALALAAAMFFGFYAGDGGFDGAETARQAQDTAQAETVETEAGDRREKLVRATLTARPEAADKAWLGIQIAELPAKLAEALELGANKVVITAAVEGAAAEAAGLSGGDAILAIDEAPAPDIRTILDRIETHKPGDTISVKVVTLAPAMSGLKARFRQLAEADEDGEVSHMVANLYQYGRILPASMGEALDYYKLAAEKGYVPAMIHLGKIHDFGLNVPADQGASVPKDPAAAAR